MSKPSIRTQIMLILFASTLLTLVLVGGIFLFFTAGYARNLGQVYLQESAREVQQLLASPSAQQIRNPVELSDLLARINPVPRIQLRVVNPARTQVFREIGPTLRTELQNQMMIQALQPGSGEIQRVPSVRPLPIMRGEHQFPPRMGRMVPRDMPGSVTNQGSPEQRELGILFGTMGFISPSRYEIALSAGTQGAIIQLEAPADAIAQLLRTAVQGMVTASLLALFITGIISLWAAQSFTAPLLGFAQTLRRIQPEQLITLGNEGLELGGANHAPWLQYGTTKEMETVTESFDIMSKEIYRWYQKVLEEQETLKSFLADASHELRTPVMAASTFVELAKQTLTKQTQLKAKQKAQDQPIDKENETTIFQLELQERLEDIDRQIGRMNVVVQTLLRSARADKTAKDQQSNQVEYKEPVVLEHLVTRVIQDTQAAFPSTRLVLSSTFDLEDSSEPLELVIHKDKLMSLVQILIENCFIHGSQKLNNSSDEEAEALLHLDVKAQKIENLAKNIHGKELESQFYIELKISDQGEGFSHAELLGTPRFRQASGTIQSSTQGLGIGLITAQKLVDQLGGSITFKSQKEKGFEAILLLPADDVHET